MTDEDEQTNNEWATVSYWWHEQYGGNIPAIRDRESGWWHKAIYYGNQGYTLLQAVGLVGAWPATQIEEELKKEIRILKAEKQRQHDAIVQQAATIQKQRDEIEWDHLTPEAQRRMYIEAARRIDQPRNRRWQRNRKERP